MPLAQPLPDLVSLDLLQSVADLGSIRQAALAHGMSQPAASMRLRTLERTIGLELLDRSSGRAQLTPSGRAVVQWSERILDGVRSLLVGAEALRTEGRIQLRVAASMTVAEYLVPAWLSRLRATDPSLRVSLQMGNSGQVADLIGQGAADLGFVEGPSVAQGLETVQVLADQLVLVVAPTHPWARRRRPVGAAELAATALVLREAGSGTREVLEQAMARFDLEVSPLVELGSTTAIKGAVASGLGPAVLSRLAVQDDLDDGRLVAVATDGLDLDRSIRAVWSRRRDLPGPARRLLAQVRAAGRSGA